MSMTARERAILDATAADFHDAAPALAGLLQEGPELLRIRGIAPRVIKDLVPGWKPPSLRARMVRRIRAVPDVIIPPACP